MDIILIAFVCYTAGGALRTLYDYLFKIMDNPELSFDRKYIATMLISIVLSIISALVTFTLIEVPEGAESFVALSCLAQGFAMNHLVNKPVDYLSHIGG